MTLPITPAGAPVFPSTQNSPANGDPLDATQLRNDIETPFLDGIEGARLLLYGGGFRRRVSATSNTVMVIQPLGAVMVKVAGQWQVVTHTVATTINPQTLAGGAFAASTRYYVYVNVVAGAIVWSVSTTAPDAGLRYKTGDEQYQFITTFFTDSSNNMLLYSQEDSEYLYSDAGAYTGVDGNQLMDLGVATVNTNVPFTAGLAVPAGASAVLFLAAIGAAGTAQACFIRPAGGNRGLSVQSDGTHASTAQGWMSLVSGYSFDYLTSNAGAPVNVWALGFRL